MGESNPSQSVAQKRRKLPIEEKFVLFDDASECAKAAAPVFEAQRWRWSGLFTFPKEHNILDTLLWLKEEADNNKPLKPQFETGRLIYYYGKFGYERPKHKEQSNV